MRYNVYYDACAYWAAIHPESTPVGASLSVKDAVRFYIAGPGDRTATCTDDVEVQGG